MASRRRAGDFLLRRLGLLHQLDFLVLDFGDVGLARVNFVGQRAVFLVLARLQLLVGVFLDLRFLRFDVEFEPFAVGLDLFDAVFGGFELRLGGGGPGAEGFAFRADVGEFLLRRDGFSGRGPAKSDSFSIVSSIELQSLTRCVSQRAKSMQANRNRLVVKSPISIGMNLRMRGRNVFASTVRCDSSAAN